MARYHDTMSRGDPSRGAWNDGTSLFLRAAHQTLGTNVADPKIRTLAYLCAGGAGISAINWALGVLTGIFYNVSGLRKASSA